eukprot:5021-Heterococcus_DN1.PRE.3
MQWVCKVTHYISTSNHYYKLRARLSIAPGKSTMIIYAITLHVTDAPLCTEPDSALCIANEVKECSTKWSVSAVSKYAVTDSGHAMLTYTKPQITALWCVLLVVTTALQTVELIVFCKVRTGEQRAA